VCVLFAILTAPVEQKDIEVALLKRVDALRRAISELFR
jgi:hypothetical protein